MATKIAIIDEIIEYKEKTVSMLQPGNDLVFISLMCEIAGMREAVHLHARQESIADRIRTYMVGVPKPHIKSYIIGMYFVLSRLGDSAK